MHYNASFYHGGGGVEELHGDPTVWPRLNPSLLCRIKTKNT